MTRAHVPAEEDGLLQRARTGDRAAWSRLYVQHYDGLFRHLRYLTGDANVAEELCQECFVTAMQTIDKFEGRAQFSTWLHGIGLNMARGHWRSGRAAEKIRTRLSHIEQRTPQGHGDPTTEVLREQRVLRLYAALDQLPAHLREAFILRDLLEMPLAQAAREAEVTPTNLKVRASRARARLQSMLSEEERTGKALEARKDGL